MGRGGLVRVRRAGAVVVFALARCASATLVAGDNFERACPGLGENESGALRAPWRLYGAGAAEVTGGSLVVTASAGAAVFVLLDTGGAIDGSNDLLRLSVTVTNLSGAATPSRGYAGLVYNKASLSADAADGWLALVHQALGLTDDFSLRCHGVALASSNSHTGRLRTEEVSLEVSRSAAGRNTFTVDGTPGTHGSPRFSHEDQTGAFDDGGYFGLVVLANPGQEFSVSFDDFRAESANWLPPGWAGWLLLGAFGARRRRVESRAPVRARGAEGAAHEARRVA